MTQARILIVDDEPNILTALARALRLAGHVPDVAAGGREALELLATTTVDLVMLDVKMPPPDGIEVLREVRRRWGGTPVIMMSGHGTIETAVEATRLGAFDFIEKPIDMERIEVAIEKALEFRRLQRENDFLRSQLQRRYQLIGQSPAMQALRERIRVTAASRGRVLITGENGTGKELVARSIHILSPRGQGPFERLNCAAIPHDLIESELFGHEKGSFTGASTAHVGRFERAHSGTLFLDEIGDMPLAMQAKLLRVLQEGEIERVGGRRVIEVDVRVIAATNKEIEEEVRASRFRADLYYRLNVIPIHVPPLRERREDIPLLCEHFLDLAAEEHDRPRPMLSAGAIDYLAGREWPGNVRELRNMIERLVILSTEPFLDEETVRRHLQSGRPQATPLPAAAGRTLKEQVQALERLIITRELEAASWNIARTARALGVERSHLYKKMARLGIPRTGKGRS